MTNESQKFRKCSGCDHMVRRDTLHSVQACEANRELDAELLRILTSPVPPKPRNWRGHGGPPPPPRID